jgi:peptidoglycan/LPS O-acetylase OafA/YrhL
MPVASPVRFEFIDGLRGLAISMVLLRHYYVDTYSPALPRWLDCLGLGYLGVHLFLLLSGFCVSWPYVGPSNRAFAMGDFIKRRASRILPAYYVALLFAILLNPPDTWQDLAFQVATHMTLTHNFFFDAVLALNGPFWSLALEFQLYLLFPLMFFFYRGRGALIMIVVALLFQVCYRIIVAILSGTTYNDATFVLPWGVLGRVFDFALGVLAAVIFADEEHCLWVKKWNIGILVALILSAGFALVSKRTFGETAPSTDLFWSIMFFCLLLVSSAPGLLLHKIMSSAPIVKLGVVSYSIYLTHMLVLKYFTSPIRSMGKPFWTLCLLVPTVLVTIAICYGFYILVERPSVEYFARRRRTLVVRV